MKINKSLYAFVRPVCFYSKDNSHCVSVKGYRDNGAEVTLEQESVLKSDCCEHTGKTIDLVLANGSKDKVPIIRVNMVTAGISNDVCICMVPMSYRFPSDIKVILGNDLCSDEKTVSMVTRSQTKRSAEQKLNFESQSKTSKVHDNNDLNPADN